MHRWDQDTETLAAAIVRYAENRIAHPQPLDGSASSAELTRRAGATITAEGLGGFDALRVWTEVLAPATLSTDHPANLAFVPGAPTKVVLFRRRGWSGEDYVAFCRRPLEEQVGFVMPTSWQDEKAKRFCFVNPRTTMDHVRPILDAIA